MDVKIFEKNESVCVNDKLYTIVTLLGKGKGG